MNTSYIRVSTDMRNTYFHGLFEVSLQVRVEETSIHFERERHNCVTSQIKLGHV